MDFTRYFLRGLKGTLRFNNGVNLSYKGPWVEIFPNTVIDEFYVGDFMSAEYTICVDGGNVDKEIIKCLVVAGPSSASITIYGRTSLQDDMITLSATVNDSKLTLLASPIGLGSKKLIFSVSYYHTLTDIINTSPVVPPVVPPVIPPVVPPVIPSEPGVATYILTPAVNNIDEGSSLTFNVSGTNITNGTYYWTVTSSADFGTSTGTFSITSNTGSFTVIPSTDTTTEGSETFTASVRTGSVSGTVVATSSAVTINDTSTSSSPLSPTYALTPAANNINEGGALTINVATTNVTDATTLYWSVNNSGDFGTSTGSFTITSNTGSFIVTPTADTTTEGAETFTASVRTGSVSGTVVATSSAITINDTSTSAPGSYTINVINYGISAYTLSGNDRNGVVSGDNPGVAFNNGDIVNFVVNAASHPFWLKTASVNGTGSGISSGVTNNGTQSGTVQWTVSSTGTFYYICQYHGSMVGTITIS